MASSDLMFTPAGELAARVRGGELSSRELVQASLDRIEALDGELNAFVEVDGERALAAAAGGAFALAVSFSILTLGWHYPSDVRKIVGSDRAVRSEQSGNRRALQVGALVAQAEKR